MAARTEDRELRTTFPRPASGHGDSRRVEEHTDRERRRVRRRVDGGRSWPMRVGPPKACLGRYPRRLVGNRSDPVLHVRRPKTASGQSSPAGSDGSCRAHEAALTERRVLDRLRATSTEPRTLVAVTSLRIGRPHPFMRRWVSAVRPPPRRPIPGHGGPLALPACRCARTTVPPPARQGIAAGNVQRGDPSQAVGRVIEPARAIVQPLRDRLPRTRTRPAAELAGGARPSAERLRQVAPGAPHPRDPRTPIQHIAVIGAPPSVARPHAPDERPLHIRHQPPRRASPRPTTVGPRDARDCGPRRNFIRTA